MTEYKKTSQVTEKTHKACSECKIEKPIWSAFETPGTRICKNCKLIRKLKKDKERQERAIEKLKTKKQKKKTVIRVSDLKKKVQIVFNKWIRERDVEEGCISCGNKNATSYDAGHYLAQGSTGALRYNERNVHKQCTSCNRFKHGNLIEYRINLIKKIGLNNVEYLEDHRKDVKKWTREELNELLERYQ